MSKYVKANKLKLQDPRELNEVFQRKTPAWKKS